MLLSRLGVARRIPGASLPPHTVSRVRPWMPTSMPSPTPRSGLSVSGAPVRATLSATMSARPPQPPNIVLVLADDTGYGDVGCYNPECATPTPHVDRLAAEGIRFTDAHSPCALCTPTRYGLLTGRYFWRPPGAHSLVMPYEPPVIDAREAHPRVDARAARLPHGVHRQVAPRPSLPVTRPRWPAVHAARGRGGFRLPAGGRSDRAGFRLLLRDGRARSTSDPPYCFIENDRAVGMPTVRSTEDLHALPGFFPGLMVPGWRAEDVDPTFVERAVRFIHAQAGSVDAPRRPFFLYLAVSAPHNPWLPPDFVKGRSREGPRGDMNALVDWCVGEVRAALEEDGILDDTLLVFTSDNGPMRGQNGHRSAGESEGLQEHPLRGRPPGAVRRALARCRARRRGFVRAPVPDRHDGHRRRVDRFRPASRCG